ncbi:hypothetical protein O3M35_002981 [Rhynocoris fuscipes]|uniref:Uncharacterized protein n=1 Tax=Rhynocoris fuscipes TaxID=488301 RepID=A0AAW1CKV3_9HEMI
MINTARISSSESNATPTKSYQIDSNDLTTVVSTNEKQTNLLAFKQRNIRPRRSMSETSVYRANSRYTLKTGVNQSNKTLDRLMECFWVCSPGCQQTNA